MIIRILPSQVPQLWEVIKFAVTRTDEVESKDLQPYFNELLHALLSDKAQCFVRLDDSRTLLGLLITRIMVDKITNKKYLLLQPLYSWKHADDKEWEDDFNFIKEFVIKEKCSYISFNSRNKRIFEIAGMLGFKENFRNFIFNMEGE